MREEDSVPSESSDSQSALDEHDGFHDAQENLEEEEEILQSQSSEEEPNNPPEAHQADIL
jgi:hypothetical protein